MQKPKTVGAAGLAGARAVARGNSINIGLIAIAGDEAITVELRQLLASRQVKLYVAHVPPLFEGGLSSPTAAIADIVNAVKWLALGQPLSAIAYAGTLATIAMGEERIGRPLGEARPGVPWTTPITAALAGLDQLDAQRIVLLSPYSLASHRILAAHIRGRDVEIVEDAYLDVGEDGNEVALPEAVLRSRLLDLRRAEAQAIVICGTSLRVAAMIQNLETSAGQALAWHCLRLAGDERPIAGFGRLLEAPGRARPD